MIIGRLGKDPEVRYTSTGQAVATLKVATSEKYKDKGGNWEEKTEWHTIILWARLAEIAAEFLAKGKEVYVEGHLQTREYEKDGVKRYSTEIVGEKMQMLSGKGDKGGKTEGANASGEEG
jgi:single-strand DNA-binding protein